MTAKEYWIKQFGVPVNDSDKLAIAMMAEYALYCLNIINIAKRVAELYEIIDEEKIKESK
jgi:hypothetical protein